MPQQPQEPRDTDEVDIGTSDTLVAHENMILRAPDTVATVTNDPTRTQKPPSAPRSKWWIAALLGGLVVAAASVATVLSVTVEREEEGSSVDVSMLPATTKAIVTSRSRGDLWGRRALSEGELASWWAAELCGGQDIAAALEHAAGGDWPTLRQSGLLALTEPAKLEAPLRCGRALAKSLGDQRITEVTWGEHRVIGIAVDQAPADHEGVVRGSQWFTGSPDAVKAFESAPHDKTPPVIAKLLRGAEPASAASILVDPSTVDLSGPCLYAAPPKAAADFTRHCFPAKYAAANESLAVKLRGAALFMDAPAETGRVRIAATFIAKDAAAAAIVAASVRSFWEEMLAMVNHFEVDLVKLAKRSPTHAILLDPWLRALRSTTISVNGTRIELLAESALSSDEKVRLDEETEAKGPLTSDIDAIVFALSEGKPPPTASLVRLLGESNTMWLTSHKAKKGDCQKIVTHAKGLHVAPTEFGKQFKLTETWEACDQPLPPPLARCLLGAKDIGAMAACKPPRHPDEVAARAALQGRFHDKSARGEVLLHIRGEEATFLFDGQNGVGPWTLRSADSASCVAALPRPGGESEDVTIELLGPDLIRMRRGGDVRVLAREVAP